MSRAIFVRINKLFPQLSAAAQADRHSAALRHCACGWWRLDVQRAAGVGWLFGVYETQGVQRIVCGYRIAARSVDWPVLPIPSFHQGRRYVPPADGVISDHDWALIVSQGVHVPFGIGNPIRYGAVSDDGKLTLSFAEVDPDAEGDDDG